jgi:hypothetical protein
MNETTLLTIMAVFVAIAAIALLAQAVALVGLFIVARDLRTKVFGSWPQIESIIGSSKRTVEQAEHHIGMIGSSSVAILEVTKQQLVRVDELLSDASMRAKVQLERAEMVLDDTMTRVQQTVSIVQRGVLSPVREVHGIISGIRSAFSHLSRGGRTTVEHVTSDEEMFI